MGSSTTSKDHRTSQKGCYKKTKHAKLSEKQTCPTDTHTNVRNVHFSENLTCFVFLKHSLLSWNPIKWQKTYIVNPDATGRIAVALLSLKSPNTLTRIIYSEFWYFPRNTILERFYKIFRSRNLIQRKYVKNCHMRNLIRLKNFKKLSEKRKSMVRSRKEWYQLFLIWCFFLCKY